VWRTNNDLYATITEYELIALENNYIVWELQEVRFLSGSQLTNQFHSINQKISQTSTIKIVMLLMLK